MRAAARAAFRIAGVLAAAALIIVAAPVSLVAGGGAAAAWLAGWPPGRLYRAALWCVPMLVVWLAATAIATRSASQVAEAPYLAWLAMWHRGAAGSYPAAAAVIAPPAIPAGLAAGGLCWAYRIRLMETGSGGLAPDSAAAFDLRQWRHQARSARARIAAPGAVPLTTQNEALVAGAVIRTVGHPARRIASIPYARMRSHQVVIGTTGTGKTTLLLRLWAGFMATALRRNAAGRGGPPLLVVLDCKGGADARRIADRVRRVLRVAGARSTAIWPDEAGLSLWALPPAQLITTLVDLVEHGTGSAAYYADVMEAVVGLAVQAPGGPPGNTADFLARLDPGWLTIAYASGRHDAELGLVRSAARQIGDIALRFRTLFRATRHTRRRGPGRPAAGGRSCSLSTSSAPFHAGCRCGSFMSGPGRWAWPSRYPPSRGRAWRPMRTSATGSPRPPTAASGCCAPRIPSPSRRWPEPARSPKPRGGCVGPASGPIRELPGCVWTRWSTRR